MFFDPECIPCIFNQAYKSSSKFTNDKNLIFDILKEIAENVADFQADFSAPLFSSKMQSIIAKHLNIENLYDSIKLRNYLNAKKFAPALREFHSTNENKLEAAIKIAIAGNAIDLGANPDFNIGTEILNINNFIVPSNILSEFTNELSTAKSILYIGDNFEETIFDEFLIKEINSPSLVFAVRSAPVLNDVTLQDALFLKLDSFCKVIESGSKIAGTYLTSCSKDFIELFNNADIVISKGQGNFETLINAKRKIYHLFKVKCNAISNRSGFPVGSGVFIKLEN